MPPESSFSASPVPPHETAPEPPRHALPDNWKLLPPLSPLTYYRRNVWRVLPVGAAIMISVFLIASIVTLLNSIDASIRTNYGLLNRFSVLAPQFDVDISPRVRAKAAAIEGVAQVVPGLPYFVPLKTLFGEMPVPVYGIEQDDMKTMLAVTGNRLVEGRLPQLNEPEIVLSRRWANNFGVRVGDKYSFSSERLPSVIGEQKIVGILEGGDFLAFTDATYLFFELPDVAKRTSYLYVPKRAEALPAISKGLRTLVDEPAKVGLSDEDVAYLRVFTYEGLVGELRRGLRFLYTFLAIADILVIGAVALLSGFLANIYFEQRLGEFGLLSALGFRREKLARRLIVESGSLVLLSWLLGVAMTALFIYLVDIFYIRPNGLVVSALGFDALLFTLPTPIFVGLASLGTVLFRLYRLDPIEIMERR